MLADMVMIYHAQIPIIFMLWQMTDKWLILKIFILSNK